MGQVEKIFKVVNPIEHSFTVLRQSPEAVEDFSVKKVIQTKEGQTGDHNVDGSRPELVNVCYGTGDPPVANTTPIGTIYIQYTA